MTTPQPPRWYSVNNMGMATLCADKADAEDVARTCDIDFPRQSPHRAVQLVELSACGIGRDEILSMARESGFDVRDKSIRTIHSTGAWNTGRGLNTTNEDRKLLELAAKVHGYIDDAATPDTEERQHGLHKGVDGCFYVVNQHGWTTWNPRTDDGDSRMLQVACRIALHFEVIGGELCAEAASQVDEESTAVCAYEPLKDDDRKAARMAILRCAGMIGDAME